MDCARRHANKVKVGRCIRRQQDACWRPKMEHDVGTDAVARMGFVEDNVQRFITGTVHEFQALVGVLVHDDGHAGYEHEDGRHRNSAVVSLAQHHQGLFFRRLALLPLVLGDEDPEKTLPLSLEGQDRLGIEIPAIPVERSHHRDTRFPWNSLTFMVTPAVEEVHVGLVLNAFPDACQQPPQPRIPGRADLLRQDDHGREPVP